MIKIYNQTPLFKKKKKKNYVTLGLENKKMFFKWNNLFSPLQVYNPNRKTRGEKLEEKKLVHI